jgi:hypothetical protein
MSRSGKIAALQGLAQLVLDHRLSQLRLSAERLEQSRMQIAALEQPLKATELGLAAAGQVALRYQLWADVRRAELNTVLARQSAEWLAARDDARHAFGRSVALRGVAARLTGRG